MIESEEQNYFVPSSNLLFNERQKSIFDVLDKVGKEQPANRYTEEEFQRSELKMNKVVSNTKQEMKQFVGKESIFKRPEVPLNRNLKRKIPDFKVHPNKWTKYSLENVNLNDMTDKTNTATAFAFLKELSDRKTPVEDTKSSELPKKIIFNKHVKLLNETQSQTLLSEDDNKPSFISGKYVMPEYTIGQKPKPKKTDKIVDKTAKNQMRLDHLFEEDEES